MFFKSARMRSRPVFMFRGVFLEVVIPAALQRGLPELQALGWEGVGVLNFYESGTGIIPIL